MIDIINLINGIQNVGGIQNPNNLNRKSVSSSLIGVLEDGTITFNGVDINKIINKNRNSVEKLLLIRDKFISIIANLRSKIEKFVGQVLLAVTTIQNIVNTINSILITLGIKRRSILQTILGY